MSLPLIPWALALCLLGCDIKARAADAANSPASQPPSQRPTAHQAAETLAPVTVQGLKRDTAMMPYQRSNEMLSKLQQHGQGLFTIEFQLRNEDPKVPLQTPQLAVLSESRAWPIRLSPELRFQLPVLPAEEAKDADLATNIPKGQKVSVRGSIRLTTAPDQLDLGAVRRIVGVSHRLRSELLPWYLRWLFPRMDGVRICADQAPIELEWREQGQLLGLSLPIDAKEQEPEPSATLARRYCAVLTGKEAWPDQARLVAQPGMRLSIHGP